MPKLGYSGRWALAGFCSSLASSATAKPPEPGFWLIGNPPGSYSSTVTALTQSGIMAAGGGQTSFSWTLVGGRDDFGLLPGMPIVNYAMSVSDKGEFAGSMWIEGQYVKSRAYRWTGSGALQDLGVLPGWPRSFAWGISGDGAVVVGHAEGGQPGQSGEAFRWTAAKGMQGLGHLTPQSGLSQALAVSRDGKVVVGTNRNEVLHTDGFVWTEAAGMKPLASLIGGSSGAEAVNADGSVVAGYSAASDGYTHAVRWVDGKVEDLTLGSIFGGSTAYAVNDDGNVIGGNAGPAIIWTPSTGMLVAEDYLAEHGVVVPSGYLIEYVYAISGDGLTFGGKAKNLTTGIREGFVATIPGRACKPDCDASGTLDIDDFICFQTRFAISDPYADCDASGELNIDDFICFQTFFAVGC